jgi:pentatricopeptide repeat protein
LFHKVAIILKVNKVQISLSFPSTPNLSLLRRHRRLYYTQPLSSFNRILDINNPTQPIFEFNKILTSLAKLKHFHIAISFSKEMDFIGIQSDLFTFNILINFFCHLGHLNFAFSVLIGIEHYHGYLLSHIFIWILFYFYAVRVLLGLASNISLTS